MPKKQQALVGIRPTQALVINHLRRKGAASRVELADICNVTAAAISMMTRDLIDRGLVVEGAKRSGGQGAPHVDLQLNGGAGYALGVHANRFTVSLTLLDFRGTCVGEQRAQGPFDRFADTVATIASLKAKLLADHAINENMLLGAGIALPTRFQQATAFPDLAQEIASWSGSDLMLTLEEQIGCPVTIENDANAAAMAELALGNSVDHDNFAYLYLSEGIGSGIIIERKLYRGTVGNAGEVGALRGRGLSRPSFEDLADWCAQQVGHVPQGRNDALWSAYLEAHRGTLDEWLARAGPETAKLAFMIAAILAPSAIYLGGTLPRMVRVALAPWLDFGSSKPFTSTLVAQPSILIPEVAAEDSAAFGAAAMILHHLPGN